ncbi:hypothetical protein DV515_00004270 [Chloebia gouldiae]|uniref:Uncharacterized protein n=1 Tax=Chloebia gouldiae TaxID=44316 RepID=A0A3L8SSS7_CHLGU|nr:hypothetical protein DV515_00004270 [Chloebia gouldiae]
MASVGPSAASTQPALPSGPAVFKTIPYAFILPEIVSMPRSLPHGTHSWLKSPETILKASLLESDVLELMLNAQSILTGFLGTA